MVTRVTRALDTITLNVDAVYNAHGLGSQPLPQRPRRSLT